MASRSRILGAGSLRRKIKRMPEEVKGGVQEAISDSADVIYADALAKVPVDEGDLAAALKKKLSSDKLGGRVGYWKKGNKRNWDKAGWRAKFIEFGTRGYRAGTTRRTANSKTTKKIRRNVPARPARPFLGPAYRSNESWVINRIKSAVSKALAKASNL